MEENVSVDLIAAYPGMQVDSSWTGIGYRRKIGR